MSAEGSSAVKTATKAHLESIMAEQRKAEERTERLKEKIQITKEETAEFFEAMTELQGRIAERTERLDDVESSLSKMRSEVELASARVEESDRGRRVLEQKAAGAADEEKLVAAIAAAEDAEARLKGQLAEAQERLGLLEDKLDAAEARRESSDRRFRDVNEAVDSRQREQTQAAQRTRHHDDQDRETSVEVLEAKLSEADERARACNLLYKELDVRSQELEKSIEEEKTEFTRLSREFEEVTQFLES